MAIGNSCSKNLYAPASSKYYYTFSSSFTEQSYDIVSNTSTLYVNASVVGKNISWSGSAGGTLRIYWYDDNENTNGKLIIERTITSLPSGTTKNFESTTTINHKSDGKLSGYIKLVWTKSASNRYVPASGEVSCPNTALTTIPRSSTCSCPNFYIGNSATIQISRASNDFTHKLRYEFGTLSGIIAENVTTSYLWTPDENSFLSQIPNSSSMEGKIYCTTYDSNNNQVGSEQLTYFTAQVRDYNTKILSCTFEDINETTKALTGNSNKMIAGYSNVKVTTNYQIGTMATLKQYIVSCGNQSSNSNPSTFEKAPSNIFNFTLIDSRDKNLADSDKQKTMETLNYIPLAFTNINCERQEQTSNKLYLSFNLNFFGDNFGTKNNTLKVQWQYQLQGSESNDWSELEEIPLEFTIPCTSVSYNAVLTPDFDYNNAYNIKVLASDELTNINKIIPVSKGTPLIDKGEDFLDVHGELCAYDFQIFNEDGEYKGIIDHIHDKEHPVGSLYITTDGTNPTNLFGGSWQLYGKGKTLVGYDETDVDFNTIGKTGGSKEMQKHTHTGTIANAGSHAHIFGGNTSSLASGSTYARPRGYTSGVLETTYDTNTAGEHTHTITISETGEGNSGNMSPYIVVYFWLRTA